MRILYLLLITLLFSGCSVKTLPPIKKYTIDENIITPPLHIKNCKSIKINFPKSSDEIFSKSIIYQKGFEKNSYYFSKWYETPNDMLYRLVLSSMQDNKTCKMVFPEDFNFNTQYQLEINILDFIQKFSKHTSYVKIRVLLYLKDKKNHLITQKLLNEKIKCKTNNALGAVKAFNKASKKFIQDLLLWLQDTLGSS